MPNHTPGLFTLSYLGLSILGTVNPTDPWSLAAQKALEHGILAILVGALMWQQWSREQRLAKEYERREASLQSMIEARDIFIREQLVAITTRVDANVQSCCHFRAKVLEEIVEKK